jgi:hypothetical protein
MLVYQMIVPLISIDYGDHPLAKWDEPPKTHPFQQFKSCHSEVERRSCKVIVPQNSTLCCFGHEFCMILMVKTCHFTLAGATSCGHGLSLSGKKFLDGPSHRVSPIRRHVWLDRPWRDPLDPLDRLRLDAGIKELGVENAYFPCFVSQAMEGMSHGHGGNVMFGCWGNFFWHRFFSHYNTMDVLGSKATHFT